SSHPDALARLAAAGMDVCRLNLSHCPLSHAAASIAAVRALKNQLQPIAVWVDLNGPKIRQVRPGDKIFVDDGLLSFIVVARSTAGVVRCTVEHSGWASSSTALGPPSPNPATSLRHFSVAFGSEGMNFPGHAEAVASAAPALEPKDIEDLRFVVAHDADFVSVPCVAGRKNVEEIRKYLGPSSASTTQLLAKIENDCGARDAAEILEAADGLVVDRGYLATEVGIDEVTVLQKRLVAMVDIANAVMDGVDGIVLSAETAIGIYPLEALNTARRVALRTEIDTNYSDFQLRLAQTLPRPLAVPESVASSAAQTARLVGAAVIVCLTDQGAAARLLAKYRPCAPIVAATARPHTARALRAVFGVVPLLCVGYEDRDVVTVAAKFASARGLCQPGDVAVITSGLDEGFHHGATAKMQLYIVPSFA
ncbi:hypothetical protein HK405_008196, partial [Cladochytrium tenue]